jgi:plastocyanin
VVAGFGDRGGAANVYAPKVIDVYAGDTIAWRVGGLLEPHTITFGPTALLQRLSTQTIVPVPQRAGAPRLEINPQIALPTQVATYGGTGYVNSGLLRKGQTWRLTFTTPGTFHYYCLLHYPGMAGTVVVHPRPQAGTTVYRVLAGDSQEREHRDASGQSDVFFPRSLTIHVGDTVSWRGGFHTITFGPEAVRQSLERHLFLARPGAGGRPILYLNPQVVLPTQRQTYDGSGFANSGLLPMRAGNNTPPEYQLTFTKPGVYEYDCLIHPGMDGTITVLPAAH